MKDRPLLQELGTNWARKNYPDIWADAVKKRIKPGNNYVITDCRFRNELAAFPDWVSCYILCPLSIRKERVIKRDGLWNPDWDNHPAEQEIQHMEQKTDFTIYNYGSFNDLKMQAAEVLLNNGLCKTW